MPAPAPLFDRLSSKQCPPLLPSSCAPRTRAHSVRHCSLLLHLNARTEGLRCCIKCQHTPPPFDRLSLGALVVLVLVVFLPVIRDQFLRSSTTSVGCSQCITCLGFDLYKQWSARHRRAVLLACFHGLHALHDHVHLRDLHALHVHALLHVLHAVHDHSSQATSSPPLEVSVACLLLRSSHYLTVYLRSDLAMDTAELTRLLGVGLLEVLLSTPSVDLPIRCATLVCIYSLGHLSQEPPSLVSPDWRHPCARLPSHHQFLLGRKLDRHNLDMYDSSKFHSCAGSS